MEKVDVARLLVTELVANAVVHGRGTVVLVVERDGEGLRVHVHDEGPDRPVLLSSESLVERGAGLRLVSALADSWGVSPLGAGEPGKRVWFTLE